MCNGVDRVKELRHGVCVEIEVGAVTATSDDEGCEVVHVGDVLRDEGDLGVVHVESSQILNAIERTTLQRVTTENQCINQPILQSIALDMLYAGVRQVQGRRGEARKKPSCDSREDAVVHVEAVNDGSLKSSRSNRGNFDI